MIRTPGLPEPPRTPFELRCSLCNRDRLILPCADQRRHPGKGVYLCMHCDHGGGPRQAAPVLQGYIDRGYRV